MADAVRATTPAKSQDQSGSLGQPAALRQLLVSRGVSPAVSDAE